MAYTNKGLSVLAYANGFTLWHYSTPDGATDVFDKGYFNPAWDMFRKGDLINCNSSNQDEVGHLHQLCVRSRSATTIEVSVLKSTD